MEEYNDTNYEHIRDVLDPESTQRNESDEEDGLQPYDKYDILHPGNLTDTNENTNFEKNCFQTARHF